MKRIDMPTCDQAAKLSNFSRSRNLTTSPYVQTTAAEQNTQSKIIDPRCTIGNQGNAPLADNPKKAGNRFKAAARISVNAIRLIDLASKRVRGWMGRCTSTSLSLALNRMSPDSEVTAMPTTKKVIECTSTV